MPKDFPMIYAPLKAGTRYGIEKMHFRVPLSGKKNLVRKILSQKNFILQKKIVKKFWVQKYLGPKKFVI